MLKFNAIKILGIVTTVLTFGATMLSGYVSERKMDEQIEAKVSKALAEKTKSEEATKESTEEES